MTSMIFNSIPFINWQQLWKTTGKSYWFEQQPNRVPRNFQWPQEKAIRLIKVGKIQLEQRRSILQFLLAESRKKLDPLGEPLELDLGVHRWLKGDREEAYSDWLAWLLWRLTSGEILDLFCVQCPELPEPERTRFPLDVHRELWVKKGHEGATGRLDVVVKLPGNNALVLELKKGSSDAADTKKQEGYFQEMEKTGMRCHYLLLVTDQSEEEKDRFKIMPYAILCLQIRHWATTMRNDPRGLTLVAMALAFVGAIETNLLGLAISRLGLPSSAVLNHLRDFVEK
jgi:hypothetical protein